MSVHLVRHGETEWSRSRRHTGRTDIPLTARGRVQAGLLAGALADLHPDRVLTSPLGRARETCELAGFGSVAEVDERLAEWDYGFAEGQTTEELRVDQPGWSVWTHPIEGGESLAEVGARATALCDDLTDPGATYLVFAHAHLLRILGARWCGLAAAAGRHLVLDPASLSTLSYEREARVIERWNVRAGR
jgi:probable phosphoglycerate mutase